MAAGLVDDGQHLLRHRLGGGKEAGAEARRRNDSFGDVVSHAAYSIRIPGSRPHLLGLRYGPARYCRPPQTRSARRTAGAATEPHQHRARERDPPVSPAIWSIFMTDLNVRSVACFLSTTIEPDTRPVPQLGARAGPPGAPPDLPRGRSARLDHRRRRDRDRRAVRAARGRRASCSVPSRSTTSTSSSCRPPRSTPRACGWAGGAAISTRRSGAWKNVPGVRRPLRRRACGRGSARAATTRRSTASSPRRASSSSPDPPDPTDAREISGN